MKTFLKIIGILIILFVVYAVIAMLAFGKNYHYEKSMVIHAPKEKIWQQISSMQAVNKWNPWLKLDPKMKLVYSGTSGQIGDQYCGTAKTMMQAQAARKSKNWFLIKGRKRK
ncbi:hypothetical protein [uncultured Chryseobacterium sp.]|uniref:hypothetical protein n=1 Tax=uncultured Chryseobacterium sp. TaxID=259322 RepID=UPI0025CDFBF4|nr:hypothetical protein [uncultured Chryseobacterium sp.]